MGAREPFISEDPVVLLEDIFRDLHQEGQQINMASPEVAEEERVELEATMAKEIAAYRGQEDV